MWQFEMGRYGLPPAQEMVTSHVDLTRGCHGQRGNTHLRRSGSQLGHTRICDLHDQIQRAFTEAN